MILHAEVPEALRRYVADQDYARYTETDHAVWRRVIGTIAERLGRTAHPSYARGFAIAGMQRDRVPRITTMDRRLEEIGWRAVAVDGFIPPRAFQAFQASRILPIARDVRRPEHLEYTPAPDILHEAAGHAPMLADPEYSAFAQRIGELGMKAFTLPHDVEAFEAIRALSILKESADTTAEAIDVAERRVEAAMRPDLPVSEAGRLARLYWWTIEYGLVGTVDRFALYGAGLLSSLGESESCLEPNVRKLPLTASCVDVAYDITRPQPQLFVTPSFAALHDVLDEVMATTSFVRGGLDSIAVAIASGEAACLRFAGGATIAGRFVAMERRARGDAIVRSVGPIRAARGPRDPVVTIGAGESIVLCVSQSSTLAETNDGARTLLDGATGGVVSVFPASA